MAGLPAGMPLEPDEQYHPGGFINSSVPGRTDRLPLAVAADSHVIPADVVSGLGQGSSLAGARILDAMLQIGPYGTKLPEPRVHKANLPKAPAAAEYARGGSSKSSIIAAGGEYIAKPDQVEEIGRRAQAKGQYKTVSASKAGHEILDQMIANVRKHTINFLKNAPAPKK